MDRLLPIAPFIDPTIKQLTQKSLDKFSSILIALRRVRGQSWEKYTEDFIEFLKKIEKQDPELYVYPVFLNYISKYHPEPIQSVFNFLERKGYNEQVLSELLKDNLDEGAFINRLPKQNAWFLWLCVFYLFDPRQTQKFFMDNLIYPIDKSEEELVMLYRTLPIKAQDKFIKTLQEVSIKYTQMK